MKYLTILLSVLFFSSCSKEPHAINYGKDICENCKMTIMDMKFGGELINKKGKALKFDSGECMLKYLYSHPEFKVDKYLIVNYSNPGEMIEAKKAVFIIGGNVKSPMGGALAAFANNADAMNTNKLLGGNINSWETISHMEF